LKNTEFHCLPTAIGSVPQIEPAAACEQVFTYLPEIPAWPQLPRRSFLENMYVQYSQGFPGVVVTEDRIYVDRERESDQELEALYLAYLENDASGYGIDSDHASGLHTFLQHADIRPLAVKGQVTGPISWGLTVTDQNRRSVIYDDTLADAAAKLLRLKAAWQEQQLRALCPNTIVFLDEPYLVSFGSAFVSLSRETVITLLNETLGGITGISGIHCCGNTDWSVVLGTNLDILSYDTYNYAESLSLYPDEVKSFLGRGGAIAWGIVPNEIESVNRESVASLRDRLEAALAPFTHMGIPFRELLTHSLLTPSCTLSTLESDEMAARTLEMLNELSAEIRRKYL
jgi:hypothetical protein